jgi:hypothetical protein
MFAGLVSAENKVADTNRPRLKQWLAGHNVHIDTRFFIVEMFAASGGLRAILLGHPVLLG